MVEKIITKQHFTYHELSVEDRKVLRVIYIPDEEDPTIIHEEYEYRTTDNWQRDKDTENDQTYYQVYGLINSKIQDIEPETIYGWVFVQEEE